MDELYTGILAVVLVFGAMIIFYGSYPSEVDDLQDYCNATYGQDSIAIETKNDEHACLWKDERGLNQITRVIETKHLWVSVN